MSRSNEYNGGLTCVQLMLYEIRTAAKMAREGGEYIFRFPTEREFNSIFRSVFKRIDEMESNELDNRPVESANGITNTLCCSIIC